MISSPDMSNVLEEKKEDFLPLSLTYVSTNREGELIFLFLRLSMCVHIQSRYLLGENTFLCINRGRSNSEYILTIEIILLFFLPSLQPIYLGLSSTSRSCPTTIIYATTRCVQDFFP
jgi:hypothetical protein